MKLAPQMSGDMNAESAGAEDPHTHRIANAMPPRTASQRARRQRVRQSARRRVRHPTAAATGKGGLATGRPPAACRRAGGLVIPPYPRPFNPPLAPGPALEYAADEAHMYPRSVRTGIYVLKWLLVASIVGFGGGLSAVALRLGIDFVGANTQAIPLWLSPAIGGAIAAVIFAWDRESAGFGTDRYIAAVNQRYGLIRRRTVPAKFLASVATIGFRGSGGVEGPMVLIGGGIANTLDRFPAVRRWFTAHDRRLLTVCGAAGAIGAVFHSPLAGGIFVVEVLYRSSLHYADLFPALLSSAMGFVAYGLLWSTDPLLQIPEYVPQVANVHLFILAAIASGLLAFCFVRVFDLARRGARLLRRPFFRPIAGGLLAGLLITRAPQAAGIGLDVIQDLILGIAPWHALLILGAVKIVATAFTVGSGGSAGLVIPALFIGAVAGNLIAGLVAVGNPGLTASLVVSGMSASLATVANIPVSAAVLSVELVGLRLGVPATIGSVVGYVIGKSSFIYGGSVRYSIDFGSTRDLRDMDRTLEE